MILEAGPQVLSTMSVIGLLGQEKISELGQLEQQTILENGLLMQQKTLKIGQLVLLMILQTGLRVLLMTLKIGQTEQLMTSQAGQSMLVKIFVNGLLMQPTKLENSHQIYSIEWDVLEMMLFVRLTMQQTR